MNPFTVQAVGATVVYALLGMALLIGGFYVVDRMIPTSIWDEIVDRKNTALAIVVGAGFIAMALIIAAVVR